MGPVVDKDNFRPHRKIIKKNLKPEQIEAEACLNSNFFELAEKYTDMAEGNKFLTCSGFPKFQICEFWI